MANIGSMKKELKEVGLRSVSIDAHPALADFHAYFQKHPSRRATEGSEKLLKFVFARNAPPNSAARAFTDLLMAGMFESDRGCVLVAASVIDKQLESMFRELFQLRSAATPSEIEFFLTALPLPPLQSTGIKIRLAFVLGLIDRPLMRALNQLQSLRSRVMAHSREIEWLTPEHAVAINNHLLPKNRRGLHKMTSPEVRKELKRGSVLRKPKGLLMIVAMVLSSLIEKAGQSAKSRRNQSWMRPPKGARRSAQANSAKRVSSDSLGQKTRKGSGT